MKSEETTADRRNREAAIGPVILYGTPSQEEIAQARGAGRGVLVLPDEMRGHIPEMHTDAEWAQKRDEANVDAAIELLRKAIRTFPETWGLEGVRFVEFHKEIDAEYARYADTLIIQLDERLLTDDGQEIDLDQPAPDLDPEQHFGHEHPGFEDDGLVSSEWLDKKPEPGEREWAEPRVTDQEPHDHYTDRARRLCAEGDHDSAELWDRDAERVKVREAEAAGQDRIAREDGVVDITRHSEDTLFKVLTALKETGHTELDASNTITAILNAGILFREPAPDYDAVRESTEAHIREVYFDGEGADVDTRTDAWMGETVQAEEPIEDRLQRAFCNGFIEGVRRGSYGRWDHS